MALRSMQHYRFALPIRIAARLLKVRLLARGLWPGGKIPKTAKDLAPGDAEDAAGVSELRTAIARLKRQRCPIRCSVR
jgi:hypothetical protein